MATLLKTPRQASTTFDLGGATPPRSKGLFFARFTRADNSQGISPWQRQIGFLIKSVDQPTITPKVEEINQYNKKRQIHTGYTINPVTMTFYDTADGMVLRMWNEYVRYYFGDFAQDPTSYNYDIVTADDAQMFGTDVGYGFTPRAGLDEATDLNSQFFFSKLEIFQVYRQTFTKVTIINPKFTSFDPDELDYEQSSVVTYKAVMTYEAAIYDNNGAPQAISSDPLLAEAFEDTRLSGDPLDVAGQAAPSLAADGSTTASQPGGSSFINPAMSFTQADIGTSGSTLSSGIGGVLGAFGNFSGGAALGVIGSGLVSGSAANMSSEIAYAASGDSRLASILNLPTSQQSRTSVAGQFLSGARTPSSRGISGSAYSAAVSAVEAAAGVNLAVGDMGAQVVQGVLATSAYYGTSPGNLVSNDDGLAMTPETYDVINAVRPPSSQIGFMNQSPPPLFDI